MMKAPKNSNPSLAESYQAKGYMLTPMLEQYLKVKEAHQDAFVFYRMGDFYELFFDDAEKAAPLLEVTLTSRNRKTEHPIAMAGIPYHAAPQYIDKLLKKGHKVAICDQVEDPATAKGIVKREVVRTMTPALIGDPDLVPPESQNFVLSVYAKKAFELEVAAANLLAMELRIGRIEGEKNFHELLLEICPKEILVDAATSERKWFLSAMKLVPGCMVTIRDHYYEPKKKKDIAQSALLLYLEETQKLSAKKLITKTCPLRVDSHIEMSQQTCHALELFASRSQETPSVFDVLNQTKTSAGSRTLKEWLRRPLKDLKLILNRQEAVYTFFSQIDFQKEVRKLLAQTRDIQRLSTKTALGLATPRDVRAIGETLSFIPQLKELLEKSSSSSLHQLSQQFHTLAPLCEKIMTSLREEVPFSHREGGIFVDTVHPQVAELRELTTHGKSKLADLELQERNRTGISNLKIKFSRVFGYTIEVSKTHLSKVPDHYMRKQTISTGERFVTDELKKFEQKVLSAQEKLKKIEEELFVDLREETAAEIEALMENAASLGILDALVGLSQVAIENNYVCPDFHTDWDLQIEQGRHLVVETQLEPGHFVPNNLEFSHELGRTLILTGPNMAGKSTIMRQTALICILAQIGSFVPAKKASLPLLDGIYTRIGSSDDLSRGLSTFMVEMTEMAEILEKATSQSLILVDEIGRGTSTYDGLALAWSILEYIHSDIGAKTLFATHFHEISKIENQLPAIKNMNVKVLRSNKGITFLHELEQGICNKSFGIEVAKLAKLPPKSLQRASQILAHLESSELTLDQKKRRASVNEIDQLQFFNA